MAFMRPEYTSEPFVLGETTSGEGFAFPADAAFSAHWLAVMEATHANRLSRGDLRTCRGYVDGEPAEAKLVSGRWFARLSAPGYLDATEWDGPHATEQEAAHALSVAHDVCCDCGEDLPEDGDGDFCEDCEPLAPADRGHDPDGLRSE